MPAEVGPAVHSPVSTGAQLSGCDVLELSVVLALNLCARSQGVSIKWLEKRIEQGMDFENTRGRPPLLMTTLEAADASLRSPSTRLFRASDSGC